MTPSEQKAYEQMRCAFEQDFIGDGPSAPHSMERSGDGYKFMIAQSAWTTWKRAWIAALSASKQVEEQPKVESKPSSQLTDQELADHEYMRAYIDALHEDVAQVVKATKTKEHGKTSIAPQRYRLLISGVDRIDAADEFLSDDTTQWAVDPVAIFAGMVYGGKALRPARRAIQTDSRTQTKEPAEMVGINGLTDIETRATMSVMGLSNSARAQN